MMGKMPLPKLTAEQVVIVLDNAPVAVYVSAVDTLELLYAGSISSAGRLSAGAMSMPTLNISWTSLTKSGRRTALS